VIEIRVMSKADRTTIGADLGSLVNLLVAPPIQDRTGPLSRSRKK
jgi:hypothetical protein